MTVILLAESFLNLLLSSVTLSPPLWVHLTKDLQEELNLPPDLYLSVPQLQDPFLSPLPAQNFPLLIVKLLPSRISLASEDQTMLRLQLPISTLPMIFPDCKILRRVISCAALLAVSFTCILL